MNENYVSKNDNKINFRLNKYSNSSDTIQDKFEETGIQKNNIKKEIPIQTFIRSSNKINKFNSKINTKFNHDVLLDEASKLIMQNSLPLSKEQIRYFNRYKKLVVINKPEENKNFLRCKEDNLHYENESEKSLVFEENRPVWQKRTLKSFGFEENLNDEENVDNEANYSQLNINLIINNDRDSKRNKRDIELNSSSLEENFKQEYIHDLNNASSLENNSRRRVVKKLIRVQPVSSTSNPRFNINRRTGKAFASSEQIEHEVFPRKFHRKKIKIKKRRKLVSTTENSLESSENKIKTSEEDSFEKNDDNFDARQENKLTKNQKRRKLVITKKRLLNKPTEIEEYKNVEPSLPQLVTLTDDSQFFTKDGLEEIEEGKVFATNTLEQQFSPSKSSYNFYDNYEDDQEDHDYNYEDNEDLNSDYQEESDITEEENSNQNDNSTKEENAIKEINSNKKVNSNKEEKEKDVVKIESNSNDIIIVTIDEEGKPKIVDKKISDDKNVEIKDKTKEQKSDDELVHKSNGENQHADKQEETNRVSSEKNAIQNNGKINMEIQNENQQENNELTLTKFEEKNEQNGVSNTLEEISTEKDFEQAATTEKERLFVNQVLSDKNKQFESQLTKQLLDGSTEEDLAKTTETTDPTGDFLDTIRLGDIDSINVSKSEENSNQLTQNLPDYEPFFPELSESLDAPILLLKTTLISSVEYQTKTVIQSRLRTYTFVVTRVNGDEQIVTSTTEVKPQTKTVVLTEPVTKLTTLTLLDFDATNTIPYVPLTVYPSTESHFTTDIKAGDRGRVLEEARYNLATRIMSNGVEVIVAGDKSTYPGEPDVKRLLPSTVYKPITLRPSTLSNHMMMVTPKDASNIEHLSSSLYTNEFVTKTCLTTFTYLTTYLENGTTTVSSHEQVVSNIATEERNTRIQPTPSMGITLTQYPNLAVGVFLTTYTYLNTIMDGEQPIVVTSKHVVSNTVTAPDDYLSLLKPLDKASAVKDTNTYYSTLTLEKTLTEGHQTQIVSTNEVVTQVVITESIPSKATSVMTSYIALDVEDAEPSRYAELSTTDVTKTYFVTYTYYNTVLENDRTVIHTNVSTESDVVTEKLFLPAKKSKNSQSKTIINTTPIHKENLKVKPEISAENFEIFATKTYLTTFTYFTTLLQETSTVISSHSRVVENVVTETVNPNQLDKKHIKSIKKAFKEGSKTIVRQAALNDGNKLEITAIVKDNIKPTKVLPIEKTKMPEINNEPKHSSILLEASTPTIITGSTILFVEDEDPFAALAQTVTPSIKAKVTQTHQKNELSSLLSSEIVRKTSSNKIGSLKQTNTKRHISKTSNVKPSQGLHLKPTAKPLVSKSAVEPIKNTQTIKLNNNNKNANKHQGVSTIKYNPESTNKNTQNTNNKNSHKNKNKTHKNNSENTLNTSNKNSENNSKNRVKQGAQNLEETHHRIEDKDDKLALKNSTIIPAKKKIANKVATKPVSDLLGLSSININSLQALKPVLSAMAGLIQTNLKASRRNDSEPVTLKPKITVENIDKNSSPVIPTTDVQNRSPIYIPVGDIEVAESQNIANIHISEQIPWTHEKQEFKDQIVIGKPTHESPLLNGGIPISPGEVITANSDVIIGKPGRIGPRIPAAIPLNPDLAKDNTPIGMKPPPIPRFEDNVGQTSNKDDYIGPPPPPRSQIRPPNVVRGEKYQFSHDRRIPLTPHGPNNKKIPLHFEKQSHLYQSQEHGNLKPELNQENRFNNDHLTIAFGQNLPNQNGDQNPFISNQNVHGLNVNQNVHSLNGNQNLYGVSGNQNHQNIHNLNENHNGFQDMTKHHQLSNQNLHGGTENHYNENFNPNGHKQNLGASISFGQIDNLPSGNSFIENKFNENFYNIKHQSTNGISNNFKAHKNQKMSDEPPSLILGTPINDFNIQPSILNEPIVLPEVIERSTGQPLLVNIQPSQVAFVNIPHNRTTALIYGGSMEPHRNGQYFDDPSPYPEPEFSAIESFNNGIPKFASVYNENPNLTNQKEVVGVIKVGTQLINSKPEFSSSNIVQDIRPTRPNQFNDVHLGVNVDNRDVNLKAPPISFEMVHHGNDFNAHIINHGGANPSAQPFEFAFNKNQFNEAIKNKFGPNINENQYFHNHGSLNTQQNSQNIQQNDIQNMFGQQFSFGQNNNGQNSNQNHHTNTNKNRNNQNNEDVSIVLGSTFETPSNFGQNNQHNNEQEVLITFGQSPVNQNLQSYNQQGHNTFGVVLNDQLSALNVVIPGSNNAQKVVGQQEHDQNVVSHNSGEHVFVNHHSVVQSNLGNHGQFNNAEYHHHNNRENNHQNVDNHHHLNEQNIGSQPNFNSQNVIFGQQSQGHQHNVDNLHGHNQNYGNHNNLNQNKPSHHSSNQNIGSEQNLDSQHVATQNFGSKVNQNEHNIAENPKEAINTLKPFIDTNSNHPFANVQTIKDTQPDLLNNKFKGPDTFGIDTELKPPQISTFVVGNTHSTTSTYNGLPNNKPLSSNKNTQGFRPPNEEKIEGIRPPNKEFSRPRPRPGYPYRPKLAHIIKRPLRPLKPKPDMASTINEFMMPPPIQTTEAFNGNDRPFYSSTNGVPHHVASKPKPIPLNLQLYQNSNSNNLNSVDLNTGFVAHNSGFDSQSNGVNNGHQNHAEGGFVNLENNSQNYINNINGLQSSDNIKNDANKHKEVIHEDEHVIIDNKEDNVSQDDGEVIQESNSRPLLPGEVPHEILKSENKNRNVSLTENQKPNDNNNDSNLFMKTPNVISDATPLNNQNQFVIRPENHQTNEIVLQDHHDGSNVGSTIYFGDGISISSSVNTDSTNQITTNIQGGNHFSTYHQSSLKPNFINSIPTTEKTMYDFKGSTPPKTYHNYAQSTQRTTSKLGNKYTINSVIAIKKPQFEITTHRPSRPIELIYSPPRGYTTKRPTTHYSYIKNSYQNHNNRVTKPPNHTRPKVTSLPIDIQKSTTKKIEVIFNEASSQTEVPFNQVFTTSTEKYLDAQSGASNVYFDQKDTVSNTPAPITTTSKNQVFESSTYGDLQLNIGEIPTGIVPSLTAEREMEIMKPPPITEDIVLDLPVKQPDIKLQPPKIEVNSPSGGIFRVPHIGDKNPVDLEMEANTHKPFIPQPSENMLPPPKAMSDEEVMGLSPPPPVTTHRPILQFNPNISTNKPVYSLEIDIPKSPLPDTRYPYNHYTTYNYGTTTITKSTSKATRRPYTRRPTTGGLENNYKNEVQNTTPKWQRPVTPITKVEHNKHKNVEDENQVAIKPTPSLKVPSTMEVIIGRPQNSYTQPVKNVSKLESSEEVITGQKSSTPTEILGSKGSTSQRYDTTVLIKPSEPTLDLSDFTTGVHHGGNEIKVIDDTISSTTQVSINSQSDNASIGFNKPTTILPTKYITHTKTSTVTITKTTVVKSHGSPPSTMTILVTKTEKSTIVDTVTEFHTLVKPTSIIETITTTVKPLTTSLYRPDIPYGSPQLTPIQSTPVVLGEQSIPTSILEIDDDDDSLEEFIISDPDPPTIISAENNTSQSPGYDENESILIVMTDKKGGSVVKIPPPSSYDKPSKEVDAIDVHNRDEMIASNEVNRVLLGGILIASPPSLETTDIKPSSSGDKCNPECKASKNELCQKVERIMRCVCRPGFARMFPDRPCKPTYTYVLKLALERYGKDQLQFEDALAIPNTPEFNKLSGITHDGLDRMVMQSDLRDIYHGIQVKTYEPSTSGFGVVSQFYLQLSDNADENRLQDVFKKYLRNNNYSLGGTELYAARETLERLEASDFDECTNQLYHDCSENAQCFNLKGTYTCSCKEGFADLSENILYPGRICSAEQVGCEKCHYHGTCYTRDDNQILCECFQWYAGENCHINLKVLLIALVTLGIILFTLLLICIIMTCCRKKPQTNGMAAGMSFLPQRIANQSRHSTLDRRAMIQDTSSESGASDTNTLPYVAKKNKRPKGALKKTTPTQAINPDVETGNSTLGFPDQKDRSLTVMIPRAKYHPAPPTSPHLNLSSFENRKNSAASSNEAKLLSYLDAGPTPNKVDKRKYSLTASEQFVKELPGSRKTSGALVSAGFEVSATVMPNNMGTMGTIVTTCGTEADRSENATLIQKISADLLSSTGTQSQFNTFKKSIADGDEDFTSNWLDIPPRVTTISESRSYDETTIQPPMKSFRNDYDSKPSSQHPNDEANTMAERDLGSTFLLPHTHLYKPDRGSDISGFESL